MKEAPVFVRCYDLIAWLLDKCDTEGTSQGHSFLRKTLLSTGLRLLENIRLALHGHQYNAQIQAADTDLVLLRLYLRLAEEKHVLSEAQYRFALESADDIGRQLGGWLRRLERL